ncbi:hypothetical protein F5Y19DRAFT_444199 [Xylariaceae sp. FL1651]|nr:hypothetical protein F5Y19DRAFT_444199 [Xylariaceae sp. FL1651]
MHEEDWVYSLLGIFGFFMPLIYGKGRDSAATRLRKEIGNTQRYEEASSPGTDKCLAL